MGEKRKRIFFEEILLTIKEEDLSKEERKGSLSKGGILSSVLHYQEKETSMPELSLYEGDSANDVADKQEGVLPKVGIPPMDLKIFSQRMGRKRKEKE